MSRACSTLRSFRDLNHSIQDSCFSHFIVRDGNKWSCQLCNTGPTGGDNAEANEHRNGSLHQNNFAKLKHVHGMARRTKWVESLASTINQLSAVSWKLSVKQLCFDYIFCNDYIQQGVFQDKILDSLRMYAAKEKLSLLELAIWKGHCLVAFIEATNNVVTSATSLQDIDDYWKIRSEPFNAAEFRRDVRVRCGSAEIVHLVLPFLGREFDSHMPVCQVPVV